MPRPKPGPSIDTHTTGASWGSRGACRGTDPELFFDDDPQIIERAKQVCSGCEVRAMCLEQAIAFREEHGVWGGMTWKERKRLVAARRNAAA